MKNLVHGIRRTSYYWIMDAIIYMVKLDVEEF